MRLEMCHVTRVGTYLYEAGITTIVHFIVMLLDPVMASAVFPRQTSLDETQVAHVQRIARVYLHRNGTRKGLYILSDVSSGRERRDEDGCELIKQNSRTISLGFSTSSLLF